MEKKRNNKLDGGILEWFSEEEAEKYAEEAFLDKAGIAQTLEQAKEAFGEVSYHIEETMTGYEDD